ncbi:MULTISPECIES: GNAT family N-acetyltransferase [Methanosarcina]|jgi:ribosomal-protein-alanine N-acetyltransferase|nr:MULTISPECIES: GNAT family protein [Methanosarcina]AAM30263.1 Acetyltransferase [Methanosarcina mazei Go1]AKB63939.1 N-acetyltransferase [Methanosarcina mazei S-6]KKF97851.1 acetyltransferase [Methanosarcina mazei]KKF99765.1 acetyltransferase [Methanosarcina mazei]KKG03130.1 acetyltransferase [Methanosarcina mazei]
MLQVKIRPQEIFDAERFFEIFTHLDYQFIEVPIKTLEDEKRFLKLNEAKRKTNFEHNYSILLEEKLVGGCGIRIDQHRPWTGEIGYFVDKAYQGMGIATEAVRQLEKIGFDELKLQRITILMDVRNTASEKIAVKCGYEKEGIAKKIHRIGQEYYDCFVYAKTRQITE